VIRKNTYFSNYLLYFIKIPSRLSREAVSLQLFSESLVFADGQTRMKTKVPATVIKVLKAWIQNNERTSLKRT
jgi:hypothetical protein